MRKCSVLAAMSLLTLSGCATLGLSRDRDKLSEEFAVALLTLLPQWTDTIDHVNFKNDHPFIHTRYLFTNINPKIEFALCLYGFFDADKNTLWVLDSELAEMRKWGVDSLGTPFSLASCRTFRFFYMRPDSTKMFLQFVGTAHSHTDGHCIPSFPRDSELFMAKGDDQGGGDLVSFIDEKTGFVIMIVCGSEKVGILTRSRHFMIHDNAAQKGKKEEDF